MSSNIVVSSLNELMNALSSLEPVVIEISTSITCPYSITLPKRFSLVGRDKNTCLLIFNNSDGIALTADNKVETLTVLTTPNSRAFFIKTGLQNMGTITMRDLNVIGQVSIITRSGTDHLKLNIDNIHISSCDSRHYSEQPQKYGVNVYQGALTVYNFNGNPDSDIHATITNITIGSKNSPVLGSGVFISGFGDNGGWIHLDKLTTGAIYSSGMLPYGTADIITAAVFIVYGVISQHVEHFGEIATYGVNDMVLDTWGKVENWIAHKPIVSYGPSGIGFVNFGIVNNFKAESEVVTHGLGARGFNQYDGTVKKIQFKSIETFGNGSIGIQISKPVGTIIIDEDIITHGSIGNTLVKGVIMPLPAEAFSVKSGGSVDKFIVGKNISTFGDNVTSYAVEGGKIGSVDIKGTIIANGQNSNAILVDNKGSTPLTNVHSIAKAGIPLLVKDGQITDKSGYSDK